MLLKILGVLLCISFANSQNTTIKDIDKDKVLQELNTINENIKDNVWINKYQNYITYVAIKNELSQINKNIRILSRRSRTNKISKKLEKAKRLKARKKDELNLLIEHKSSIFGNLSILPKVPDNAKITNPIMAIFALSSIQKLNEKQDYILQNMNYLNEALENLDKERLLLKQLILTSDENEQAYRNKIKNIIEEIEHLKTAKTNLVTSYDVFKLKTQENKISLQKQIKEQFYKLSYLGVIIFILFMIGVILKGLLKRYTLKNKKIEEKSFFIKKIINAVVITISILILFFSYLEDASYMATVLGFASAGIAIAMKDWFMSLLGWISMLAGNSVHIGDRIKVMNGEEEIVGDLLDISLLTMTILEDVTLTTYTKNRRGGRIISIPNNYIFSHILYNYSQNGLKTVWDGIDILVTFDSNYKKAILIAQEISKKYSQGYTDITRQQLNKLRRHYNLRNTNAEPKVFSFIDESGIKISVWYVTNSFATLSLRSTISAEIIDAFLKEEDIKIGYSTQTIKMQQLHQNSTTHI